MITIHRATSALYPIALELVGELFVELAEDPAEFAGLDLHATLPALVAAGERFAAFIALDDTQTPVGVVTVAESIAPYAGGWYGIIPEMYVRPAHRSANVGALLLDEVKAHGRSRGWRRVDVTAQPGERWQRTVDFYERNGFVHTGPKLRFDL